MALVLDGDNGIVGVLATNTDGDVIFDTDTLFVDAVENKVGIGTTAPNSNLHIKSTTDVKLTLETDEDSDCWINLSGATSEASIGYEPATNSLRFANAADGVTSNVRMTIDASGNVGIGTTSPVEKLEVNGSVKVGNLKIQNEYGGRIGFNRNTANGAIYDSSYAAFQINGATSTLDYLSFEAYPVSGSASNAMSIKSNGNVGIGTTSPGAKLEVNGTVTATAFAGSGDNITGVAKISNASTPPSVGAVGTMYYNTTAGVLYISNGAAWVQSYKNPANGSSSGSAAEYGSDIIALGLGAGLYWLTGRVAANRPAQQVYVDADGWMLFYRHAGTSGGYNSTYEIIGDTLGESAVGTLTSPTQGLTDAGSSTAAGSRGVARLSTEFIRSLGGDSAANNVYRVTTGSVTAYITDAQWWSTADGSSDGYGRTSISCGNSYANRRSTSASPDVNRPMGTYNIHGPTNVIPWYHGNNYSGGYNPIEGWHISATCWVREF